MQSLQAQNTLLRDCVAGLQRQNQTRALESKTLLAELDRLTLELERRQKPDDTLVVRLTQQLHERDSQIMRLSQEKQRLIQDYAVRNKAQPMIQQLSLLQQELKISKEQKLNTEIAKKKAQMLEIDVKNLRKELENVNKGKGYFEKRERDLQNIIHQKDMKIEDLERKFKDNEKGGEVGKLVTAKLALEAKLRQLIAKNEALQLNVISLQKELEAGEGRIRTLQKQAQESRGTIARLRKKEDILRGSEANSQVLQKQMEALQLMITTLKENRHHLEESLSQKERETAILRDQIYRLKSSNLHKQQFAHQIKSLQAQLRAAQDTINELTNRNQVNRNQVNNYRVQEGKPLIDQQLEIKKQLQRLRDQLRRLRQPPRRIHPINNLNNGDQWDNLQRKIKALKYENQGLKRYLFSELSQ